LVDQNLRQEWATSGRVPSLLQMALDLATLSPGFGFPGFPRTVISTALPFSRLDSFLLLRSRSPKTVRLGASLEDVSPVSDAIEQRFTKSRGEMAVRKTNGTGQPRASESAKVGSFSMAQLDILVSDRDHVDSTKVALLGGRHYDPKWREPGRRRRAGAPGRRS